MDVLLASATLISCFVIACAEGSEGHFCGFITQGLFPPGAANISETSRCGDLRRVRSLLTVYETDQTVSVNAKISDCTSPVMLRTTGTIVAGNHATSSTEDVVVECIDFSNSTCTRLFFNLRQPHLDSSELTTKFPAIISPNFHNVSTARVAGCNVNNIGNLLNSSETPVSRGNYSHQRDSAREYLYPRWPVMAMKIQENRIYVSAFNRSFVITSLVRTLLISNVNFSSLLHHNLLINLTDLVFFDLSHNGLNFLPENLFHFNKVMLECDLGHNSLQSIPANLFKYNTKLKNLNIGHNHLETLPPELFLNNREIKQVFLDHNRLSKLPNNLFVNNFKMIKVTLSNNYLTELPRDLFSRDVWLRDLNLSHNQLRRVNLILLDDPTEKSIAELARFHDLPDMLFLRTENNRREIVKTRNSMVKTNHLTTLNVSHNRLTDFPSGLFEGSQVLSALDASSNPDINRFTNSFFFSSCRFITLTDCGVQYIAGSPAISISLTISPVVALDLDRNRIRHIDGTAFRHCRYMELLFLSDNILKHLEAGLFRDLDSLLYLSLSGNMLESVPFELLSLQHLRYLDVSRNRLRTFDGAPLIPLLQNVKSNLQELDLSHNCLTSSQISSSNFSSSTPLSLIYGNFEFNALTNIPVIPTGQRRFHLHFGNNAIKNIEMNNLVMQPHPNVRVYVNPFLKKMPENSRLSVCPNPIKKICETSNHSCQDVTQESVDRLSENFPYVIMKSCQDSPDDNISSILKKIKFQCPFIPTCSEEYYQSFLCEDGTACDLSSKLVCPVTEQCPSRCECHKVGFKQRTVVNCSHGNLTNLPPSVPQDTEVLYFEHNKLKNLSRFREVIWKELIEIYLDYNEIKRANLSYLPSAISKISLRHNRISGIAADSLGNLTGVKIWLEGNPFLCDCDAFFLKTLVSTSTIIADGKDLLCFNSSRSILETKEEEMCIKEPRRTSNATLAILMGILVPALIGTIFVAYYRNKRTVAAYLFTHYPRIFACFCNRDEIVEDKRFDAFISYSGTDTAIVKELIVHLEEKEPRLKLCIHERDWMPGEYIANNIANSVCSSRKTLLIMSKEFLESIWFPIELRSVYYRSMEDKVNRLVVVVKGELPSLHELDEDLQVLLKSKTYLIWGERWFWEKLRYALSQENM